MKKLWVIPLIALVLAGCGREKTLETITDTPNIPVVSAVQRIQVYLPAELSTPVLQDETAGTLYLCDDYALTVQTVSGGNLEKTIHNATGKHIADLQILQTQQGNAKCYQWMWTTNGEKGIQVGRGCVLDDGAYHYVLIAQADESSTKKVQPVWKEIFASFSLASEREEISTGS